MSLLDADAIHPITLPDGRVYSDTVYLKNVIDHPRIEVGVFSYFTHSGTPGETAQILAPYLGHECCERLVIGKFVQIARGSYFITSSANHPMTGFTTYPFRIFKPETFGYKDLPVRDTVVGHDVWIGHDAAIMPGVRIGSGAIVAAAKTGHRRSAVIGSAQVFFHKEAKGVGRVSPERLDFPKSISAIQFDGFRLIDARFQPDGPQAHFAASKNQLIHHLLTDFKAACTRIDEHALDLSRHVAGIH